MGKKMLMIATLIMTICLLTIGVVCKRAAKNHQGMSVSFGIVTNGQYTERSTGRIGENKDKYESLNNNGTIFCIFSGITGIVFVAIGISYIRAKKQ